ncbi:hypothetical protein F0562_017951 [Nyssa sinensis]|uniref:Secreted protein n=1 Tax=Nyssa sinensis TaxID=561372 RepID=A0A5J4ZAN3_9ASTE|nr:hypothetical protein F0562_017951 [Nyssa sinensis]
MLLVLFILRLLILNWLRLDEATVGPDHARAVGSGLIEATASSGLAEAWVKFERLKLVDFEPSFPQSGLEPRSTVPWSLFFDKL